MWRIHPFETMAADGAQTAGENREGEDYLKQLKTQRRKAAEQLLAGAEARFEVGVATLEEVLNSHAELLAAELDLADSPQKRIAALSQWLRTRRNSK